MLNFAQAQYLLLLLLIPVFFIVQAIMLKLRRRRVKRFGDEELVSRLMPSYSRGKVWVRLTASGDYQARKTGFLCAKYNPSSNVNYAAMDDKSISRK